MHSPIPGSEMTREPFRWDQRLFSLVLRLSGTPAIDRDTGLVPSDSSPIDAMCEVTGGMYYEFNYNLVCVIRINQLTSLFYMYRTFILHHISPYDDAMY